MIGSLNVGVNLGHPLWQFAHLEINYDEGATVTVNNGSTTLTAPDMSGYWEAPIPFSGIWLVTSTKDGESVNESIEILEKYETYSLDIYLILEWSQSFAYTGSIQSVTIPVNGLYKMEVYGGQGDESTGQGGYSIGYKIFNKNDVIYVCVGGQSATSGGGGGYNGGGTGSSNAGHWNGGGGATHMANVTGTLVDIGVNNLSQILLIAGGGGGHDTYNNRAGGKGGGLSGTAGSNGGNPGTQNAGGSGSYQAGVFGKGGSKTNTSCSCGGGGGGLYGGGCPANGGGGGGSGYIGGCPDVIYKEQTYIASTETGINNGNGSAIITLIK